jgi:hypothetical protein
MNKKVKKKPILAFVDHPFHKKTRSSFFIREILKKKFTIKNFWSENINYKCLIKFDNIFFWQVFLNFNNLIKLKKKNIIWAPMYDSLAIFDKNIFKICKIFNNVKILSFTDEINKICSNEKIKFLSLKYMIKPVKSNFSNKINIFFWYRGEVKITDWISQINKYDYNKIYYYNLPDPCYSGEKLSKKFKDKYKISVINGNYKSSNEFYQKTLKKCQVYIAPRKREGIGMSIIEAMSLGKYLIGYNENTLNQYIKNNKLGMFIKSNLINLDKNYIRLNTKYRYNYYKKIYRLWNVKKKKIYPFFQKKNVNAFKKKKNLNYFRLLTNNYFFTLNRKIINTALILRKNFFF